MRRARHLTWTLLALLPLMAGADTLELANGTVVRDCFVRDEGTRVLVWTSMDQVGGPATEYPRSQVKEFKIQRTDAWDAKPNLPDLSVTYIEMTPKLAGLHGRVDYDTTGRPKIMAGGAIIDIKDRGYSAPEEAVKNLKLAYKVGEAITLTAHVKNVGFAPASPFEYEWLIDGASQEKGRHGKQVPEMVGVDFKFRWKWQAGEHTVTFRIKPGEKEIATLNDEATDPLWGWGLTYIVSKGRVKAWHDIRTASGTFCFEDYYRWHIDIMNRLFAASVYPSAPNGIRARVRLDRIIYADNVDQSVREQTTPQDPVRYDQGGWTWTDSPEELQGKWGQVNREWRCATEWSLPHELGHQLGLVDHYATDYAGTDDHKMADNGDKVTHFQRHPVAMMHWHGPQVYNEADAGYLNTTWNKPRGYFGDYYFALPADISVRVLDVNGNAIPAARVEVFQRGVAIDPKGTGGSDGAAKWAPVLEDGNFERPIGNEPVITGETDAGGLLRLANRPVTPVKTLNGFERRPNPFGNINVVGGRGLLLVRVTVKGRQFHYFIEAFDMNVAWFRGEKEASIVTLNVPLGGAGSPTPPQSIRAARTEGDKVTVTWEAPPVANERAYLDHVTGYRIYRRVSSDGLNDRPWEPMGTVAPTARQFIVDLKQTALDDIYWYTKTNRFAVSVVGESGVESDLVPVVLATEK